MCGIVGAVAQRDVVDILVEGLKRLDCDFVSSRQNSFFEEG